MNILQASVQSGMVHADSPGLKIMQQLIQIQTALQQQEQESQAKVGTKIPSTKKTFGTKMMGTK
jgi:hypothetical protein